MDVTETSMNDELSFTYNLEQEENTLVLDSSTTFDEMKESIKNESYTELEFNQCPAVSIDSFLELVPLINENMRSLILHNVSWINDECVEMLTAYCHKIRKLELYGCLPQITRTGIESIGRNCSMLLSLSIICVNDDENVWLLDSRIFPALINNMTSKLHHFAVSGFDNISVDSMDKFFSYFRKSLFSLDFSNLSLVNGNVLKSIGNNCVNLQVLKLNSCAEVNDNSMKLLLFQKTRIEVIELCNCENITDVSIELISKNCPRLTILKLDNCYKLTEKSLISLSFASTKLSYLSIEKTSVTMLPTCLVKLKYLNYLNVKSCEQLLFPKPDIIEQGLQEIRKTLLEYDIMFRLRCFVLGAHQAGKTSLCISLQSDKSLVSDTETFGIPVLMWHPFVNGSNYNFIPTKWQEDCASLSIELWDCSGRKQLESIHCSFMNMRSIYIISFNLTMYTHVEKVAQWVGAIQARAPGSFILIVGSHSDLTSPSKTEDICQRIMKKIQDQESNNVREIREELQFLRDLGLFSMIGSKRRRLEWLLERRPVIHPEILIFSAITNQGINDIRRVLLTTIMNNESYFTYITTNSFEKLYQQLHTMKRSGTVMFSWKDIKNLMLDCGIAENNVVPCAKLLTDLGIVTFTNQILSTVLPNFNANNRSNLFESSAPADNDLVCIDPPLFADAMALLHRTDDNPQELLNSLLRGGHVDALWPGKQPYDWTFRKCFNNVISNGMIRESIIPLLVTNAQLSCEQFELLIRGMQEIGVLISGAPNATYDVELVVPSMKNLSVYKRYFLPYQGTLPVIPQVNVWQPKCPETHVQVGWDYRFVSCIPPNFILNIVSMCTKIKDSSEILSYWQSGAYIKNGDIDICIAQYKEKLLLQVLARAKIANGVRQAVNRAWCMLAAYFCQIELIISMYPGLYYEVVATNNNECKPILEVIDEYEASDITDKDVLWFIPLKDCTRSSIKSSSLPPSYLTWLKSVADQNKVHISHTLCISTELKPIIHTLTASGYEVTTDASDAPNKVDDARLILVFLTTQYFKEGLLATLSTHIKEQKLLLVLFEENLSVENQGYENILLNKGKVDLSAGTGSGSSYQADTQQLKLLVEACHVTVFGRGSLGEENKRVSVQPGLSISSTVSLTKKPIEQFAEIIEKYSGMNQEAEIKHVAATAVAAAVATATAEHIAKQSNPTMGAKAAAMAAEVADAVAKGDSERAAKAIIATAKSVDEVIAFSKNRNSVTKASLNGVAEKVNNSAPATPKSAMCSIL